MRGLWWRRQSPLCLDRKGIAVTLSVRRIGQQKGLPIVCTFYTASVVGAVGAVVVVVVVVGFLLEAVGEKQNLFTMAIVTHKSLPYKLGC